MKSIKIGMGISKPHGHMPPPGLMSAVVTGVHNMHVRTHAMPRSQRCSYSVCHYFYAWTCMCLGQKLLHDVTNTIQLRVYDGTTICHGIVYTQQQNVDGVKKIEYIKKYQVKEDCRNELRYKNLTR